MWVKQLVSNQIVIKLTFYTLWVINTIVLIYFFKQF